jgi:hypothetical protein
MRNPLATLACMIVVLGLSSPAWAEPKTVKACQEEWRANKADNQVKGVTEKAYVTQCRAGVASTQPASTPAPAPSAVAPAPVKTAKACRDEWQANKAGYQAAKITEKTYIGKCRAGEAVALPNTPAATSTPAAPAPTAAAPAPAPAAPAPAPGVKPSQTAAPPPAGADQFQTEAQAKSHCPAELVVWANLTSKIYHFAGHKRYGTTKSGAYMCETEATTHGFRASKTEKRPGA